MSEEQLKAFLEKVKGDTSLKEKLKAAKSPDDMVSIAREHGHEFGTEHISQLSEEELEGLAAGCLATCGKLTTDYHNKNSNLCYALCFKL